MDEGGGDGISGSFIELGKKDANNYVLGTQ